MKYSKIYPIFTKLKTEFIRVIVIAHVLTVMRMSFISRGFHSFFMRFLEWLWQITLPRLKTEPLFKLEPDSSKFWPLSYCNYVLKNSPKPRSFTISQLIYSTTISSACLKSRGSLSNGARFCGQYAPKSSHMSLGSCLSNFFRSSSKSGTTTDWSTQSSLVQLLNGSKAFSIMRAWAPSRVRVGRITYEILTFEFNFIFYFLTFRDAVSMFSSAIWTVDIPATSAAGTPISSSLSSDVWLRPFRYTRRKVSRSISLLVIQYAKKNLTMSFYRNRNYIH